MSMGVGRECVGLEVVEFGDSEASPGRWEEDRADGEERGGGLKD